jgi:hypothetical protein
MAQIGCATGNIPQIGRLVGPPDNPAVNPVGLQKLYIRICCPQQIQVVGAARTMYDAPPGMEGSVYRRVSDFTNIILNWNNHQSPVFRVQPEKPRVMTFLKNIPCIFEKKRLILK